jgi:hypothetical protein
VGARSGGAALTEGRIVPVVAELLTDGRTGSGLLQGGMLLLAVVRVLPEVGDGVGELLPDFGSPDGILDRGQGLGLILRVLPSLLGCKTLRFDIFGIGTVMIRYGVRNMEAAFLDVEPFLRVHQIEAGYPFLLSRVRLLECLADLKNLMIEGIFSILPDGIMEMVSPITNTQSVINMTIPALQHGLPSQADITSA